MKFSFFLFFFFSSFSKAQKVKYIRHLWNNHPYFFQWIFLWKISKKELLIQAPGRRTSRTTPKNNTKKIQATQNFIKYKITGMVNLRWCIFWKSGKKFKIKLQDRKLSFLGPMTSNAPIYIDPSGHFVFHDIYCGSNFYNSFSSQLY